MKTAKKIVETLLEDELFEMANFQPKSTGLRQMVWFSGDPLTKHQRPRGKVRVNNRFYPFSLDEPIQWLAAVPPGVSARDFSRIAEFVRLNRATLLAYWNGEIDTMGLVRRIQKLGEGS